MILKQHFKLLGLSLLSALLFIISWQPYSIIIALFGAFIPLLFIQREIRAQQANSGWLILYAFISFFVWNLGSTYWLWNATIEGAYAAFLINTLLMCLPVMVYHFFSKRTAASHSEWILITAWLSFEYLHHSWEFSWPWLSLGNAFSAFTQAVQWYEFTGVMGGSFWILYANIKVFRLIAKWKENSQRINISRSLNLVFFIGFAPLFLSWYVLSNYKTTGVPLNAVVVQPNIDPYSDKFEGLQAEQQTQTMLQLANSVTDSSVQLICFPETALQGSLNEDQLTTESSIYLTKKFLATYPNANILSGADTYKFYPVSEKTFTARKYNEQLYYDAFNTALLINQSKEIAIYHKAKLVPGVEGMPYQQFLGFMGTAFIDLGGTSGSLGKNSEAENFNIGSSQLVAPVICYESVFGEYVADYVSKGAGLLCIITNDGWWGNTSGYAQHFDYARLRAIETRRYIARAANTGISGFIDDKGNVISKTDWWVPAVQKATLQYLTVQTFYVKHARYIELLPVLLFVLAVLRRRNNSVA
jgi:apolipoprotein N-acyltransferase